MLKQFIMCAVLLFLFVWIKTWSLKNGDPEVKFECDECVTMLQDDALLLSKADLFLKKGH